MEVVEDGYNAMLRIIPSDNKEDVWDPAAQISPRLPTMSAVEDSTEGSSNDALQHDEEVLTAELLDVLDEEHGKTVAGCRILAEEGLRLAKKAKNFDDQLRFTHPHCARSIRSDAHYFEKHGQLPPPRRSKKTSSGSLLDDESVYMGVQRWLRCQEMGKVSAIPAVQHSTDPL